MILLLRAKSTCMILLSFSLLMESATQVTGIEQSCCSYEGLGCSKTMSRFDTGELWHKRSTSHRGARGVATSKLAFHAALRAVWQRQLCSSGETIYSSKYSWMLTSPYCYSQAGFVIQAHAGAQIPRSNLLP